MKFTNYLNKSFYFILFLLMGLGLFFWPSIKTSFDLIIGDATTTPYKIFVLEHSYLWLNNIEPHSSFWSAPFNYPNENSLAYSDALVGFVPLYFIIKIFIKDAVGAFQALFCLACILNYSTFYYFLKNVFKKANFSNLAVSICSAIFAFGLLRYSKSYDIAYFSHFFSILCLIFLFKTNIKKTRMKNHLYFLLASLCLILQFYTCFELGFFFVFIGLFALVCSFVPKTSRDIMVEYFKKLYLLIIFYFVVVFLMLLPLAYHFVQVGEIVNYNEFLAKIFDKVIWFKSLSVLDSFLYFKMPFFGYFESYNVNGSLGIFTFLLALFGLIKIKENKIFYVLVYLFTFFISAGMLAFNFWRLFYFLIPSTEGLDTLIGAIFVSLILVSIFCCYALNFLEKAIIKNKLISKTIFIIVVLVLLIEQIPYQKDVNSMWKNYVLSKKEFKNDIEIVLEKVPKNCDVISVDFEIKNAQMYGRDDLKYKKLFAEQYSDILAMHLTLKSPLKTSNNYFSKEKNNEKLDEKSKNNKCEVLHIVDINKL